MIVIPAREYLRELIRTERLLWIRFFLTSFSRTFFSILAIALIQQFLGGILGDGGGLAGLLSDRFGNTAALWVVAALLVTNYLLMSWATYDSQIVLNRLTKKLELGVMQKLIRHLLTLSLSFFERNSHGDLIQAMREDVMALRIVVRSMAAMLLEGCMGLGFIAAAIWISPLLTLWVLVLLPVVLLPVVLLARRMLLQSFQIRRQGYLLFDLILQMLRGIRVIKIFRGEKQESEGAIARASEFFETQMEHFRAEALGRMLLEVLAGGSIALVVIIGGLRVLDGQLGWPSLLAFLLAVRSLHGPLTNVNTNFLQVQKYGSSLDRLTQLLAEKPELADPPDPQPLALHPSCLEFHQVSFRRADDLILRDISLRIRAGESLGIAGPSGSGKTTLLNLAARLFDPSSGSITLDGVDLRKYRMAELHDRLGLVTQEPFLFDLSVRENIRCGRIDATDEEVEEAARRADIHREIEQMWEGYETQLGVGRRQISTGQAQRLSLARAILKGAPILLLDEATASLDSLSESRVQEGLQELMRDRIVMIVAHRLSTLHEVDHILVLDQGRCVGLGSHAELLRSCPLYQALWETQHPADSNSAPEQPQVESAKES